MVAIIQSHAENARRIAKRSQQLHGCKRNLRARGKRGIGSLDGALSSAHNVKHAGKLLGKIYHCVASQQPWTGNAVSL